MLVPACRSVASPLQHIVEPHRRYLDRLRYPFLHATLSLDLALEFLYALVHCLYPSWTMERQFNASATQEASASAGIKGTAKRVRQPSDSMDKHRQR